MLGKRFYLFDADRIDVQNISVRISNGDHCYFSRSPFADISFQDVLLFSYGLRDSGKTFFRCRAVEVEKVSLRSPP